MSETKRAWCDECWAMVEVVDESEESDFTGPKTETYYFVRTFECGHQTQTEQDRKWLTW